MRNNQVSVLVFLSADCLYFDVASCSRRVTEEILMFGENKGA